MKKFNKKTTAFFLAILMLLTFVPSLSFADEPAAPMMILRMDSDYYKKGDSVSAEVWVYNVNFNVAGFALKFDTESVKLIDGEDFYKSVIFDEYHSKTAKGIFTAVGKDTAVVDNAKGLVKAVFFVNTLASDAPAVANPTNKNAREVRVGADGYRLAEIKFVAQKDGVASISLTKIDKDADFDKKAYVLALGENTPNDVETSVGYKQTPFADAESFAEMVDAIGEVTLEDENAIKDALSALDKLSDLAKELAKDSITKLNAAKEALDALKGDVDTDAEEAAKLKEAKEAMEKIAADDEITAEDVEFVKATKALYDSLSDESKAQISEELVKAHNDAVAKIKEFEKVDYVIGDVDGNGKADTDDATQILRYVCGKPSVLDGVDKDSPLFKAGDVDGNGKADTDDATQILRYVCGKPSVITQQ